MTSTESAPRFARTEKFQAAGNKFGDDPCSTMPGLGLSIAIVLGHMALGILLPKGSAIGQLWVLLTVLGALSIALWFRSPYPALCAAAYLVGADIFWRVTRTGFFWELGKYAVSATLLTGMARQKRFNSPMSTAIYLCLLIPAALSTLAAFEWSAARQLVSTNLSGPLTLAISCAYCSKLQLRRGHISLILFCLMMPLISVSARAANGIATGDVEWGTQSLASASGGFGPNQVAAMLGLAALAAEICAMISRKWWRSFLFVGLCLWFLIQSALTFSRTGLYLFALSSLAVWIFFLREQRARPRFLAGAVALALLAGLFIYPALQHLTGGRLGARFSETNLTGRAEIANADLQIWLQHFVFGTGTGQAEEARTAYGFEGFAAHTEYTRLLAEHGLLGLTALMVLLAGVGYRFLGQRSATKALVASLLIWAFAFMAVSAMRLAAPSFLIGLCFAGWLFTPRHTPALVRTISAREPGLNGPTRFGSNIVCPGHR